MDIDYLQNMNGRWRTLVGFEYAGSDNLDQVGWYGKDLDRRRHPVAQKKPNASASLRSEWEMFWRCNNSEDNVPTDLYAYQSAPNMSDRFVGAICISAPRAALPTNSRKTPCVAA